MENNIDSHRIEVLDQQLKPTDNLASFAYTNALLRLLAHINYPIIHFWTLEDTLILGLADQRLPYLKDALNFLEQQSYHYFIRNSGGLAVISNAGILNVSIFLPQVNTTMSIDESYQEMTDLINAAFPELNLNALEIDHSYCPGKFDLSVNGQKIGGMSQRRNQNGVVIMLYLSITGNQPARGELVANFYAHGLQTAENKWNFPDVWPQTMTNIDDLLNQPLTVAAAKQRILAVLKKQSINIGTQALQQSMQQPEFQTFLEYETIQMQQRQTKLKGDD
ncbi:ligase [Paucilactobacillus hokkaidonensis JCM 18461]|uniref:Ligase n=2 Tax=Paucilactobacillus hokkaidonensis TaxID=1193095 RepID=A0A0A1GRL4_9LACO|nr:lipoate--protein ligase family protein [Paucilactobacillus hokkaidonensis]BAP84957.1 ligase [Paucilactobacillus hokkaidonensis JCM 18461]